MSVKPATKPVPTTAKPPVGTGIPGITGVAPPPATTNNTNPLAGYDSNLNPIGTTSTLPPQPQTPNPADQGGPGPYGITMPSANGPNTAGTPAPGWSASTSAPQPNPFNPNVPQTTTSAPQVPQTTPIAGGGTLLNQGASANSNGVPSSANPLNVPGAINAPNPFQSNAQAPGTTAGYDPVAVALAGQTNIPGTAPGQAANWQAQNLAYQGGHQASAPGDFKRYEDAAWEDAMRRLNPVWEDRDAAFKQEMANRGIGVGTPAYQKALESQNRQRSDAEVTALYDAMRYGLQAQGQHFGQSLSNAQLAQQDAVNALQAGMANNQFGLAGAQLGEGARQFDASYGLNAANSAFNQNLANAQLSNAMGQFNAQMGRGAQNDLFGQQMAGAQFNNAIGQQNFGNALTSAGFDRDSQNQQFSNQLAANQFGLGRENQAFGQGLANAQLGLAGQNQAFGQGLANAQLGLAANAQNFGQQMDSATLANAIDQFGAMYGLDAGRFNEGQRQFDANYILQQMGLRNQAAAGQSNIYNMGINNQLNQQQLGLQERQLMVNLLLGLNGQNFNWQQLLYGGL